jgi:transposase
MVDKKRKAGFEQINFRMREYYVEKHKVDVAACGSCGQTHSAPSPTRWNGDHCAYALPLVVQSAYDKFGLHQPLARQEREMHRQGLRTRRNTLAGLTGRLAQLLTPSWLALQQYILSQPLVHADETSWRMIVKGGSTTWWEWLATVPTAAFFLIQPSRSKKAAERLLLGFDDTLVCDGYAAYAAPLATGGLDLGETDR